MQKGDWNDLNGLDFSDLTYKWYRGQDLVVGEDVTYTLSQEDVGHMITLHFGFLDFAFLYLYCILQFAFYGSLQFAFRMLYFVLTQLYSGCTGSA